MPNDTTLPGAIGWTFWYIGELAFKWVPGFVVSLTGGQSPSVTAQAAAPPPVITQAVTIQDVVHFMQINSAPGVYDQLYHDWSILVAVSIAMSLVLSTILIYSMTRIFQVRQAEYKHFESMSKTVAAGDVPKTKLRWDKVREEAASDSDQSRRLAILEADIMLSELLDGQGYRGETMADKMRQVNRAQFNTIDLAWEAHRTRNRVAHEAGLTLPPHEVQRIIGLYDKVFREFGFVE